MIHQFLCFIFRDDAFVQIALDVNVKEGGCAAQRHGCTVLLFDRSKVAEVKPLNSFLSVFCRAADVAAVCSAHFLQFSEGAVLL